VHQTRVAGAIPSFPITFSLLGVEKKASECHRVKYWEFIVNKIIKAGFSVG